MSTPTNDGEPAFPLPGVPFITPDGTPTDPFGGYGWAADPVSGMSLRDYFAAKAMQGDCAVEEAWTTNAPDEVIRTRAKLYWRIADAMIATREGGPQEASAPELLVPGQPTAD